MKYQSKRIPSTLRIDIDAFLKKQVDDNVVTLIRCCLKL